MKRGMPLCMVLLGVTLVGCGRGGLERVVVSGAVTYQGQPLKEGQIRFIPTKGQDIPMSGAYIVDGKYTAAAKGGVAVGKYKVQIEAHRFAKLSQHAGPLPPDVDGKAAARLQYLPEKYNVKTELELTIEPGSGPVTQDYDLAAG